MIDLSTPQSGGFGAGFRFSDLYLAALARRFTGALLVRSAGGDGAVFLREGAPVNASGSGFAHDFLGEVLVGLGGAVASAVDGALQLQQGYGAARPLLGAILVQQGATTPEALADALRHQTARRVTRLFALEEGAWQAAPGDSERIQQIAVPINGWALAVPALRSWASETELHEISDALLGKAVRLAVDPASLAALGFEAEDVGLLKLIERPRKPHQLELLGDRRRVRTLLKALSGLGYLEQLPARAGVPIREVVKIQVPVAQLTGLLHGAEERPPPGEVQAPAFEEAEEAPAEYKPEPKSAAAPGPDSPVVAELKAFAEEMKKKSYFEILGVTPETPERELRMCFTTLAKRFHPDALGAGATPAMLELAERAAAAVNEAYGTLADPEKRKLYVDLLADDKVKGDPTRAAQLADGKLKFEMGMVLLKKKDYPKARQYLKHASEMDPTNGGYKAQYAWSIFADAKYDRAQAIEEAYALISEAVKLNREDPLIHFFAGRVLKAKGEERKAKAAFERVLELDPKHHEAASELRLINLRKKDDKRKDEKKKGKKDDEDEGSTLSKLFKR